MHSFTLLCRRFLAIFAFASAVSVHAIPETLLLDYQLGSDFADSAGYDLASLTPYGTSASTGFTGRAWEWTGAINGPGQGLQLSFNAPTSISTYTLALSFSFSDVTAYRKIVDFSGLTAETGIYAHSDRVSFYMGGGNPAGSLQEDTYTHLLITRDDTGRVDLYLNGVRAAFIGDGYYSDTAGHFIIKDVLYFGLDDNNRSEFAASGGFAHIQLWNYVLSAEEIATAANLAAIPEPSTTALLIGLTGLGVVVVYRRRR